MVILVAGTSHTGKTLLAQRMLEVFGYPYLSIDHLKLGLIRSGNTTLTPEDDEELTEYLWPIVREMVKTAIENKQNLIVEGCYIPPAWRKDFEEEYLRSMEFVCLGMSDAFIDAHFGEIRENACAIEARLNDAECTLHRRLQGRRGEGHAHRVGLRRNDKDRARRASPTQHVVHYRIAHRIN